MTKALQGFRRVLLGTLTVALGVNVAAGQQAPARHASFGFPWPETLADIKAADKLPAASLEPFLNQLRAPGVPDLQVEEFRFAPMEGPTVCLAATVDASGRQLYFSVAVVCPEREDSHFRMTLLPSVPPHLLGAELIDLKGDGTFEIITRELAGGYQGTQTLPIYWYSVFRVRNSVPHDESTEYKEFYGMRLLPDVDFLARLAGAVSGSHASALATEAAAEARFLKVRYQRRIAGEAKAGFEDANEWSSSDDPRVQMLAVETFREIDTPESLAALKKLEKAKDYVVSQAAANAVAAKATSRQ
jgi:hypothetical protein